MKRARLITLLISLSISAQVGHAAEIAGDFDGDGEATVLDVVRLINHIEGLEYFPSAIAPLADVNVDGFVDGADIEALVDAVLERNPLAVLPVARITGFSPEDGEGDVAVTRETIVRFSVPLAADTIIDDFVVREIE